MAPIIPVAAVSCSSTMTRITAPWSNSSAANMSEVVIGKVQLTARTAIPKKVCNALIGDCMGCERVSRIV